MACSGTVTVTAQLYDNEDVYATKQITIDKITSLKEIQAPRFKVYPNPSDAIFYIEGGESTLEYMVYNVNGSLVKFSTGNTINLSALPKGMYYLVMNKNCIEKIILK